MVPERNPEELHSITFAKNFALHFFFVISKCCRSCFTFLISWFPVSADVSQSRVSGRAEVYRTVVWKPAGIWILLPLTTSRLRPLLIFSAFVPELLVLYCIQRSKLQDTTVFTPVFQHSSALIPLERYDTVWVCTEQFPTLKRVHKKHNTRL